MIRTRGEEGNGDWFEKVRRKARFGCRKGASDGGVARVMKKERKLVGGGCFGWEGGERGQS